MAKGFDALPARFYKTVDVAPADGGGFAVRLDGRIPKSPRKAPLVLPTKGLAELIAGEWDAQVKVIIRLSKFYRCEQLEQLFVSGIDDQ